MQNDHILLRKEKMLNFNDVQMPVNIPVLHLWYSAIPNYGGVLVPRVKKVYVKVYVKKVTMSY